MTSNRISYYPGCSLEGTARPFDISTRLLLEALEFDIAPIPEWACCGSSPALKMNRLLSVALAAHNLALAATQELAELLIPCPFCFRRLLSAQSEMQADGALRRKVGAVIDNPLSNTMQIYNLPDFLRRRVGLNIIAGRVRRSLEGLRVVPYYGCYLVKPAAVTQFDDSEHPMSMDELLRLTGAEVLDWDFKTECCGAGLAVSRTDTVTTLVGRIAAEAAWRKADAIVVVCQLCHANLDMRQTAKPPLPVIYLPQLLALALGLEAQRLKFGHHLITPVPLLQQKGLMQRDVMPKDVMP